MKLVFGGVDFKSIQPDKQLIAKKQINPIQNIVVSKQLAIPGSNLLRAYTNVVSFKGEDLVNLQSKHKSTFARFNDNKAWDYFRNTLCSEYSDDEVDALLDEISAKRSDDKDVFKKFYNLININQVENITYSDGVKNQTTNKQETISIPRALTPIEAKELIGNDLTKNADVQKYFKLVDSGGFESDIAIASIKYYFDSKDGIRLETLSQELFNDNRRLSQEEAITCVAYGFKETEQVQSFIDRLEKDYSGNKLDLFEAALCTVHNLDTTTTERFFELKSMQLPYKKEDGTEAVYTLSVQEAVLCAKAELDEYELKRYAELKNKPFMYSAVRDHNSSKPLSAGLIISYIKDKHTDEEIAQLAEFGFKNFQQVIDFQDLLKEVFGVSHRHADYYSKLALAHIAGIQDENGRNIFRNDEGNIDFKELSFKELQKISAMKLTSEEVKDYREILSIFKSKSKYKLGYYDVAIIAASLAKMKNENGKNIFKNEQGVFNFDRYKMSELKKIAFTEITEIYTSQLNEKPKRFVFEGFNISDVEDFLHREFTQVEVDDFRKILNALMQMYTPVPSYRYEVAAELALLKDKEGNNIFKDTNHNLNFGELSQEMIIAARNYNKQHCQNYRYLTTTLGVTPENAIHIAQNEELMARFRLVDPNIFWKGATGENKSVFNLFNSLLVTDNLSGIKLKNNDFDYLPEEHSFNNGILSFSPIDTSKQGYSISLQKALKEDFPIMIVKNKNGERENYIAYDGAIVLLRPLQVLSDEQKKALNIELFTHPHFSVEEINALEEAARHFIIDIIQENGECIISKGIDGIEKAEPFIGKELDTDTTKEKFKEILQKLHSDSSSPNITIENILRLMPKDAIIQIRPYTTKTNSSHEILYSISAEWTDFNGASWQMRVHSEDLNHIGKSWIYRVGYEDSSSVEPLFYDNTQNDFIAGSQNPNTHIFVESPEDYKNKLISNPYFQKAIRNISISFNRTQLIEKVASELNIHTSDKEQKKNEIIIKCQQNAGYYYKYKKVVDNLLKEKGLFSLSSVA